MPPTDAQADGLLRAAHDALSITATELLGGARQLVCIVARGGDETLACGALLHAAGRAGAGIDVICLTQDAAPPLNDPRQEETAQALSRLAPEARLHWIGETAGDLPARGRPAARLAARLRPLIPAQALVLLPWEGEPLVDLQRGDHLGRAALHEEQRALCYAVESRFRTEAAVPHGLRLLTAPPLSIAAKRRAMGAHLSRSADLDADPAPAPMIEHFLQHPELYILG